jgi:hypothetical protein
MKKINFLAVTMAIAMFAAVVTGCSQKKENEIPEGTKIGNVKYFTTTDEAGNTLVNFIKETENGREVQETQYTKIEEGQGFLVATNSEGKFNLLTLDGMSFANATDYTFAPYFALTVEEKDAAKPMIILTDVGNGNHLAYNAETHANLAQVPGIKESVIPLSNGVTLFQNKDGWGFAQADKEEAILSGLKAINVISVKGKARYWVQSSDYTGIVDDEGNGIKGMSANQFKTLKRKATLLWESNGVTGILVNKL